MNFLFNAPATIFGIHLYGICIVIGIIFAVIMGIKEGRKLGIYSDFIYYGVMICVPLAIVGARLWYVLFNLDQSWTLSRILGLEGGLQGLAIQGGVIISIVFVCLYCKWSKVKLYRVFDILAPGFLIGQICGRWGNFFNKELYGPKVLNEGVFKLFLPDFITENMFIGNAYRHPTFLYEALLNLAGLVLMLILRRKSKRLKSGDFMGIYLLWYGAVRIFTETLRSNSGVGEVLEIFGVKVSIVVSVLFIVAGVIFLIVKRLVGNKENYLDIIKEVAENKIDTVIFDLDGTLLDTKELIDRSFVYTFNHFFPDLVLTDEEMNSFMGPTLAQSFGKYESDPEKIEEMIAFYRKFNEENHDFYAKSFFGVKDAIKTLSKRGYNLAIVSSKRRETVIKGLELAKINQYFKVIIGCDEVVNPKPDPEGILLAISQFGDANNIMYVGDSTGDIEAGKRANVKTCGVLYSSHAEDIVACEPNYLVHNMSGILKLLGE